MKTKKIILFLYFLIIVIVSAVATYALIDYIYQQKEGSYFIDGLKHLYFSQEMETTMNNLYTQDLITEIPLCLYGYKNEGNIYVTDSSQPKIVSTNSSSVTYESCKMMKGIRILVGTMHNHPDGLCQLSKQDIITYIDDLYSSSTFAGVVCPEGRKFFALSEIYSEVN